MVVLSHYTDIGGLEGIAKNQSIRATDFMSLNDPSEYMYAYSAIANAAVAVCVSSMPPELPIDKIKLFQLAPQEFKPEIQRTLSKVAIYVTSFGLGWNDYENEEGIRTLWRTYTNYTGYCLQFEQSKIMNLLRLESEVYNYRGIRVCDVKYGINENEPEFIWLKHQFSLNLRSKLAVLTGHQSLRSGLEEAVPFIQIDPRLTLFCCTHKDPSWCDEREVRVLAMPEEQAMSRPFVGIALTKPVHTDCKSRRYIAFGETLRLGFIPHRVLGGLESQKSIEEVKAPFNASPDVHKSNMHPV